MADGTVGLSAKVGLLVLSCRSHKGQHNGIIPDLVREFTQFLEGRRDTLGMSGCHGHMFVFPYTVVIATVKYSLIPIPLSAHTGSDKSWAPVSHESRG